MTVDVLKRARLETAIWAAKLLLLCVGTVSTLVFFKAAIIPYLLNLTVSIVPQLWASFKSCFLSPLYIYIILNFIIITIAASSTFQNQKQHQQPSSSSVGFSSFISDNAAKTADNIDSGSNYIYSPDNNNSSIQYESLSQQQQQQPKIQSHSKDTIQSLSKEDVTALLFSPSSHGHSNNELMSWHDIHMVQADDGKQEAAAEDDDDNDQGFDPSPEMPSGDLLTKSVEMPRLEVEVGEHINTLDTTWKAIMEGQGKAIGRHLKKSDTWDTPPRLTQFALTRNKLKGGLDHQLQLHHSNLDGDDDDNDDDGDGEDDAVTWARQELKKSDTFSDRVSLRREKSMTQEELNQRAEAFIKKFNNDMRLQRLESDQRRFREIVNGGL
ncbi:PREDICTED: uncharacterized protein LOC103338871 [Prunus mume]|uniref:Uncharacterized protein LOC103338871 n=1 Tax=Prunus mume TaxID=102107 RepID=A0ABM0PJ45_PRUMU|nr:PREDICTED: uncharacterized protein LOC103338871 [Prunus mume]